MFPEIEPYASGHLDVGEGHSIYWETCGNPRGKPVVVLHGGPGSGCTTNNRRYFDPAVYRIVLFDQRNCGRSKPHASELTVDLSANTTWHLVKDIERLRDYLGIERWLVKGASWGSVLALAYAEAHPPRLTEMILVGAAAGRRSETDLLTYGLGRMFPRAWGRFAGFANRTPGEDHIIAKYNRLLFDSDPKVAEEAARHWIEWETAILPTAQTISPRFESPEYRLAFARLVTHYWSNGSWLDEGQLVRNADKLAGIPGVILQGRLDLGNLSGTPWELAGAWLGSELIFIEDSGHEGSKTYSEALLDYTKRFKG